MLRNENIRMTRSLVFTREYPLTIYFWLYSFVVLFCFFAPAGKNCQIVLQHCQFKT